MRKIPKLLARLFALRIRLNGSELTGQSKSCYRTSAEAEFPTTRRSATRGAPGCPRRTQVRQPSFWPCDSWLAHWRLGPNSIVQRCEFFARNGRAHGHGLRKRLLTES